MATRFNTSRASRLIGWFWKTKQSGSYGNPRKRKTDPDYYDPRTWALHAQTHAIYESMIARSMGLTADDFRSDDRKQMRLDALTFQKIRGAASKDEFRKECRKIMGKAFATTNQRGRWVIPGTTEPTEESTEVSRLRYAGRYVATDRKKRDLTDLVNGRQAYEEMLGFVSGERRGFYRVTQEPTSAGLRYFVWPMPPGERIPGPACRSKTEADALMEELNASADPRETKKWHVPQSDYTKRELAHWLPPSEIFDL